MLHNDSRFEDYGNDYGYDFAENIIDYDYIIFDFFNHIASFDDSSKTITLNIDNNACENNHELDYAICKARELDDIVERSVANDLIKVINQKKSKKQISFEKDCCENFNDKYSIGAEYVSSQRNFLAGKNITFGYGEGILDFIYTDFSKFRNCIDTTMLSENPVRDAYAFDWACREDKYMRLLAEQYGYANTLNAAYELVFSSLYTAICPPVFLENHYFNDSIKIYIDYLTALQKKYTSLIKFCFDESVGANILGKLSPAERYAIYQEASGKNTDIKITKRFTYDKSENDSFSIKELDDSIDFSDEYGFDNDMFVDAISKAYQLKTGYHFSDIDELLMLEFTKMLEADIKIKRCQRCEKYFVVKGNYHTNYCQRIADGETKTCQQLAAQENYKNKHSDDKATKLYHKYYKRYSARVKVNQIKEEDFNSWRYKAITKRDECINGTISVEQYEEWLEASFKNREKKA